MTTNVPLSGGVAGAEDDKAGAKLARLADLDDDEDEELPAATTATNTPQIIVSCAIYNMMERMVSCCFFHRRFSQRWSLYSFDRIA